MTSLDAHAREKNRTSTNHNLEADYVDLGELLGYDELRFDVTVRI